MNIRAWFSFRGGAGLAWQVLFVVAVWGYLWNLHRDNDGLWYQGDSPRHAANGIFWKDFLLALPANAKDYALRYYARYPAISPIAYPPAFYLLEAALFGLFGPSPYVAKGLVLAFALLAALYTGWGGALVLLLPGVVRWSHAVMLNVPAFALGVGALYHARLWLDAPGGSPTARRQLALTTVLGLLTFLTYYPGGVVALIIAAWMIALGRWQLMFSRGGLLLVAGAALLFLAVLLLARRWAPIHLNWAVPASSRVWEASNWTYYPRHANEVFNPLPAALAGVGLIAGVVSRRWRRETLLLLTWLLVLYAFFSFVPAKEPRYVLLACTPLTCLSVIALFSLAQGCGMLLPAWARAVPSVPLVAVLTLAAVQAWLASQVRILSVNGFEEATLFLRQVAPAEPVFYDGAHDGVFIFYVRALDPGYCQRVVLGSKLLYASAVVPGWQLQQFASSPQEMVEVLRERGGCRWLAIEIGGFSQSVGPAQFLREAVQGPEFELIRTFPIDSPNVDRLEVYRFRLPVQTPDEVDLPFPSLGGESHYHVRPISPRAPCPDREP
jgi:hypothetical protein